MGVFKKIKIAVAIRAHAACQHRWLQLPWGGEPRVSPAADTRVTAWLQNCPCVTLGNAPISNLLPFLQNTGRRMKKGKGLHIILTLNSSSSSELSNWMLSSSSFDCCKRMQWKHELYLGSQHYFSLCLTKRSVCLFAFTVSLKRRLGAPSTPVCIAQ